MLQYVVFLLLSIPTLPPSRLEPFSIFFYGIAPADVQMGLMLQTQDATVMLPK